MNLIKTSAAQWGREMEDEARRNGYRVEFEAIHSGIKASFWNGDILCYIREWHA